jgi:hypothetical protein
MDDKFYFAYQETTTRAASLIFTYWCTLGKINEVSDSQWFDQDLDRRGNKDRMKELGGAIFQYSIQLRESFILGCQKLYDDFIFEFRRSGGSKIDIWNNAHDGVEDIGTVRLVNSLANIIKHNSSFIESGRREKFSSYLIKNNMAYDGTYLKYSCDWDVIMEKYPFPMLAYRMRRSIISLLSLEATYYRSLVGDESMIFQNYTDFVKFAIPECLHDDFSEIIPKHPN